MKTIFKITKLSILVLTMVLFSCNNDDDVQAIEINLSDLEVTIDENPNNGEVLGAVQADTNENLSLSIATQTPTGALSIDSSTGELTVADASLFDFETNPVISATITGDNVVSMATVTVNLTNVNEVTTMDLEVTIDENPTDGQVLGMLQASGSSSLNFSITSQTPSGALSIDANSGEVSVADASLFDFETNPVITANISTVDAENMATVTVNLNDVQELTLQDLTVTIDENPTDGQVLGTMQTNGSGTLTFSITSQTPTGALGIDASTGELSVVDPNLFDYETNPVITATILVDDGAESATAAATINLNDVDEVSAQNTNLDIDENPSNGDIVGTLQASGSNLTYTITFQNPAGAFIIDANTGELSVADETLFDFETNPNMLATISVDNGTQSVSANAFVTINDVNEIGEFKYGGVIFWIDPASNNSEGLVCDINNQGFTSWSCSNTIDTGATGTAIGTGAANTTAIISNSCTSSNGAANIIAALNFNGYDDWFLPSKDELTEMYLNRNIIDVTSASQGGSNLSNPAQPISHWSSSQSLSDDGKAWIRLFVNGSEGEADKTVIITSRAVRTFTDF